MDGTKLDLDAVRDVQNFTKAKMVIEELDLDDLLNPPTNNNIKPVGIDPANDNSPKPEPPLSDPKSIAESIRSAIRSSKTRRGAEQSQQRLLEKQSSNRSLPYAEPPKPDVSSIFTATPSSTIRPIGPLSASESSSNKYPIKSDRDKDDLIPASKVSQSSQKSSSKLQANNNNTNGQSLNTNKNIKPGINVPEPELSAQAQEDIKRDEEQYEEVDMMPRTDEEKHLYWKTRLQILKTRFGDVTIPKQCADMEWRSLRKIYYIEMDRVSISKNVEGYKMLMIVMFFILEYVGARFLKLNITGFTVHSLKTMHRYERLLIELGEKDYSSFASSWPVELKLGGLVLVNAIIFVIAKYIFKFTGQDSSDEFFDLFQNLGNATVEADIQGPAGLDAPAPGKANGGQDQGMLGMLSGLMGAFTGGGGNNAGGGLSSLLNMFSGGNNTTPTNNTPANTNNNQPAPAQGEDADGSRVPLPKFRRRKKTTENE